MVKNFKKNVVIIGGTGFIGTYVTKNLSKKDDIKLFIFYKNLLPQNKLSNVSYYQIDKLKEDKKIVKIINNAYCLIFFNQPDYQLIKNIIKLAIGIKKIIYASTLLLYKDSKDKQKENSQLYPLTDYEYKKEKEERLLSVFAKKHGAKLCIARLANVYGDVKNRGIIQIIFDAILQGKTIKINGDGNQKRDYIFVEDAAALLVYLLYLNQKKTIEIFNICSTEGYTINELITIIEKMTHRKLQRFSNQAIIEKQAIVGNNNKIIKSTNYHLNFSLLKGLKKTYENYLKYKEYYGHINK